MQTRRQAITEVLTGTTIGMVGSWIITYLTITYVADKAVAAAMTVFFCTLWSLVRGYAIRRRFAHLEAKQRAEMVEQIKTAKAMQDAVNAKRS